MSARAATKRRPFTLGLIGLAAWTIALPPTAAAEQAGPSRRVATRPAAARAIAGEVSDALIIKVYAIQHAQVSTLAKVVTDMFKGENLRAVPDMRTNTLIVTAPASVHEKLERLLSELDRPGEGKTSQTMMVELKHAQAQDLANVLGAALPEKGLEVITLTPRRLLLVGPPAAMAEAKALIAEIDLPAREERILRVFKLQHADPTQVAQTLPQLLGDQVTCTADVAGRSVLVSAATQQDTDTVAGLIEQLDVPPTNAPDNESGIYQFPLKYAEPDDTFAEMLDMVLGDQGDFAMDKQRRLIVVKAPELQVARLEPIIRSLDVPLAAERPYGAGMRIRVVWLFGPAKVEQRQPPEDLGAVLAELAKIGVKDLALAAQTMLRASPEGEFQMRCLPTLPGAKQPCELEIEGKLLYAAADRIGVQFGVQVEGPAGAAGEAGQDQSDSRTLCELQTELHAPPGHAVVLGVTPMGPTTSVFVVQILPDE